MYHQILTENIIYRQFMSFIQLIRYFEMKSMNTGYDQTIKKKDSKMFLFKNMFVFIMQYYCTFTLESFLILRLSYIKGNILPFNWIFRKGELHVPPEIHWHLRSAPPTCNYTTLVRSQGSAPLLWSIPPAHSVWCVLHTQGPPERSFSCSQSRPKADHIAHWFRSVFYLSFAKLNQNWRFIMTSRKND